MLVNGTPVFACRKSAEKVMIIEPHPKFEILKDLVVDFDRLKTGPSDDYDSDRSRQVCTLRRLYQMGQRKWRWGGSMMVAIDTSC